MHAGVVCRLQRARRGGHPPAPAFPGGETGKGRPDSLLPQADSPLLPLRCRLFWVFFPSVPFQLRHSFRPQDLEPVQRIAPALHEAPFLRMIGQCQPHQPQRRLLIRK
jgi:hypothetical protein